MHSNRSFYVSKRPNNFGGFRTRFQALPVVVGARRYYIYQIYIPFDSPNVTSY